MSFFKKFADKLLKKLTNSAAHSDKICHAPAIQWAFIALVIAGNVIIFGRLKNFLKEISRLR